MLSTMTEQPPPGYETKDVYTTMTEGFETKDAGVPGYRPAAVPNADVVDPNRGRATEEESAAAPAEESGDDTPAKKTTRASAAKSS